MTQYSCGNNDIINIIIIIIIIIIFILSFSLCWKVAIMRVLLDAPTIYSIMTKSYAGLGGCVEFWYSLVLHASPIKICPNCADPLACFKYLLSHPWEWTTIESKEREGVELLYSFLVASHFSNQDKLLLWRSFGLF